MFIEVWKSAFNSSQQWYWHFKSKNGRTISVSESFPTKAHAIRSAKSVLNAVARPLLGTLRLQVRQQERKGVTRLTWE